MNTFALCCSELKTGERPPNQVQLLPAGPVIHGIDGRSWLLDEPERLISLFESRGVDIVIDYEHSTEMNAPGGIASPAAGWVKRISVNNDKSVWGDVEWTPKASALILNKEYRYISPAFNHSLSGNITMLRSVALTNTPNLNMKALNRSQQSDINTSLSDYDSGNVNIDLLSRLNKIHNAAMVDIVDQYIASAVFCPAQKDNLISLCSNIGVDSFRKFAETQLTGGKTFKYLTERVSLNNKSHLSSSQKAICKSLGISEEQYLKSMGK